MCGRFLGEVLGPPPSPHPAAPACGGGRSGGRHRPRMARPVTVHPMDRSIASDGRRWRHASAVADPRVTSILTLDALIPTEALLVSGTSLYAYLRAPKPSPDDGDDDVDHNGGDAGWDAPRQWRWRWRREWRRRWQRRTSSWKRRPAHNDSDSDGRGGGSGVGAMQKAAAAARYATMRRR